MTLSVCIPVSTDTKGREMIEHGTALFPVACYQDDLHKTEVSWHWHEELEVFIVENGTARVCVNGDNYLVKQGKGFFINTGVLHGVWQDGTEPCRLHSIVFHPRFVGAVWIVSSGRSIWNRYSRIRPGPVFPSRMRRDGKLLHQRPSVPHGVFVFSRKTALSSDYETGFLRSSSFFSKTSLSPKKSHPKKTCGMASVPKSCCNTFRSITARKFLF